MSLTHLLCVALGIVLAVYFGDNVVPASIVFFGPKLLVLVKVAAGALAGTAVYLMFRR
jgi:hypothetical protein